jgi:putative spermidine/putrescine transport system ATP-binding protein
VTVRLERLSYRYPGSAAGVADVDLEIGPGEFVAVIGPSGCGKTTLLKLVAGFLSPTAGRVLLDGRDATRVAPKDRGLGVVFQSYALFPHMTAAENVAYPLKVRGVPAKARFARAAEALASVGLADRSADRPGALSGGQQQRVALARALVFRPRALLLDEPLSALDAALRLGMRDEILRLQRAHGIATLHITHDQEEALSMADRVAVMGRGRLLQVATPEELYARPASRAVAAFVGHANLWDGTAAGPDAVDTPVGRLRTRPHGLPDGSPATVLVRPERVRPGPAPDGVNSLAGRIARDRFLGAVRRYDLAVGGGTVAVETPAGAPSAEVHLPPDAVQVLPPDPAIDDNGAPR